MLTFTWILQCFFELLAVQTRLKLECITNIDFVKLIITKEDGLLSKKKLLSQFLGTLLSPIKLVFLYFNNSPDSYAHGKQICHFIPLCQGSHISAMCLELFSSP